MLQSIAARLASGTDDHHTTRFSITGLYNKKKLAKKELRGQRS
jgi:hypothetical protein